MSANGLWLFSWMKFFAGTLLAPYVPTPHHVGTEMLKLARLRASDVLLDVGCGDGRLLILGMGHKNSLYAAFYSVTLGC